MGKVLIATTSFATGITGRQEIIVAGKTRVDSEHPIALANPDSFEPLDDGSAHFGVESATAGPKDNRSAKPAKKG